MRTDCSWCGRMISDGAVDAEGATMNHGICVECERQQRAKYGLAPLQSDPATTDSEPVNGTAGQSRQPSDSAPEQVRGSGKEWPMTGGARPEGPPPPRGLDSDNGREKVSTAREEDVSRVEVGGMASLNPRQNNNCRTDADGGLAARPAGRGHSNREGVPTVADRGESPAGGGTRFDPRRKGNPDTHVDAHRNQGWDGGSIPPRVHHIKTGARRCASGADFFNAHAMSYWRTSRPVTLRGQPPARRNPHN